MTPPAKDRVLLIREVLQAPVVLPFSYVQNHAVYVHQHGKKICQ